MQPISNQQRLHLVNELLAGIRTALDEQARLNTALRLARVPRVIARILSELDAAGLYKSFTVLGTQALFGYEAAGGVQFLAELLASGDLDQACAVAALVREHLPHLPFSEAIRSLHGDVRALADQLQA